MATLTATLRRHRRIGLDTAIFIYHIEASSRYADAAGEALDELARGAFEGITSVLTLMEVAVRPLRLNQPDVADEYDILLANYPHLTIVEIDRATARRAAELRATYRLRPADALQVGACLERGAMAFLTNDRDLRRVTDLDVVLLDDFVDE